MEYTKGEWKLNKHHVDSSPYEILDSEDNVIAATIYGQHRGIEEARANARLITESPNMLKALKQAIAILNTSEGSHFVKQDTGYMEVYENIARTILRAEGK